MPIALAYVDKTRDHNTREKKGRSQVSYLGTFAIVQQYM